RDPNSLIGASLISSQRSSDPLPYGLMLLGVRAAHFISPATKKRGGETKRGAGAAIPLTHETRKNMNTQRIEQVNPTSLTVDTNVRTVAELGSDFVASIKEHGVLQPVTVHE